VCNPFDVLQLPDPFPFQVVEHPEGVTGMVIGNANFYTSFKYQACPSLYGNMAWSLSGFPSGPMPVLYIL